MASGSGDAVSTPRDAATHYSSWSFGFRSKGGGIGRWRVYLTFPQSSSPCKKFLNQGNCSNPGNDPKIKLSLVAEQRLAASAGGVLLGIIEGVAALLMKSTSKTPREMALEQMEQEKQMKDYQQRTDSGEVTGVQSWVQYAQASGLAPSFGSNTVAGAE
ncbi:unnamed protein product [Polarella glacialis]|uniref:Uncharacterized protein n=1 Tax=Polarella glacialis TaxID=89957 RepID=A0A813JYE2_POLGL|nr:unnamed protein product [Polarella glacialis]